MKFRMLLLSFALAASFHAMAAPAITADVVYGHKAGMALTYDVFVPEEANGAGIVNLVSGGWFSSWRPPEERLRYLGSLLDAGYTVFAVHHGSAPRFKVPEAVSDVRAAVRHIRKNAGKYFVDVDRLGVWGGSAGGHLALMLGLDPAGKPFEANHEGFFRRGPAYHVDRDDDARVAAVVAYYAPADIRNRVGPSERFPALDFPKEQAASISPILFVTKDDPPVRLIHGDKDDLVPLKDSEILAAEFEKIGVEYHLMVIEGGDHGFRNPEHRAQAGAALIAWFDKHLN